MKHGKKYIESKKLVEQELYDPKEACELLKKASYAKFDESVEVHFNLGIDPRHADQSLRGTMTLPHGTGNATKVAVICKEENVKVALAAGADKAGADDLVEEIQKGWMDFDILIASPDMMAKVGRLGKVLGARGLMPSPKSGTVTPEIEKAVKEFKAGKLEYRNDKAGIIHLAIGKVSFTPDQLKDNFTKIYEVVLKAKPNKAKGTYFKSITLTSSMGPGIRIQPVQIKWKD